MEKENDNLADLASLAPLERTVTCRGEKITVRELEIDQVLDLLPLLEGLTPTQEEMSALRGAPDADGNTEFKLSLPYLLRTRRAQLYKVVAAVACHDPEWVRHLPASQFASLAEAVIETNADFIVSHVLPAVLNVAKMLWPGAGMTLSPSSSPQATATP